MEFSVLPVICHTQKNWSPSISCRCTIFSASQIGCGRQPTEMQLKLFESTIAFWLLCFWLSSSNPSWWRMRSDCHYCPCLQATAVCNYLSLQLFVITHPAKTEWLMPCLGRCMFLHNFSSHRLLRTPLNHFIKTLMRPWPQDWETLQFIKVYEKKIGVKQKAPLLYVTVLYPILILSYF